MIACWRCGFVLQNHRTSDARPYKLIAKPGFENPGQVILSRELVMCT